MGHAQDNYLEIFKETVHGSQMEGDISTKGVPIFKHYPCTGSNPVYKVSHINRIFADNINEEHLQERMVALMCHLQHGYHTQQYNSNIAKYPSHQTEYPTRYKALVQELSNISLQKIRKIGPNSSMPEGYSGEIFCRTLLKDRQKLPSSVYSPA